MIQIMFYEEIKIKLKLIINRFKSNYDLPNFQFLE
jgi:hypothetical protein